MHAIHALWRIASPPTTLLVLASVLALLEAGSALLIPWLGGRFAGSVLGGDAAGFRQILLWLLVVLLLQQALSFAGNYLLGSAGASTTARLRQRLYDHLQSLPLHHHQQGNPGDKLSLISRDAGILGDFFIGTLPPLIPQLITLFGAWGMMAYLDLELALYIGAAVPLLVLGLRLALRRIRPLAQRLSDSHAAHLATVEENLRLLPLLKAFGRETVESERIGRHNAAIVGHERHHLRNLAAIGPAIQAIGALLMVSVLWLSADHLLSGRLDSAAAVSLLLYGLLLFRPAGQLASAAGSLQSTLGAAQRIIGILQTTGEDLATGSTTPPPTPGNIDFRDLTFAYPGRPPLFRGFDLSIKAGETIAITGPNGSGKTTLINLLMRFNEPDGGHIELDGVDIATLNLTTLRGLIGLVPQQVNLIDGSVRDNIRYGLDDASEQAIIEAMEQAQARDFIKTLPDGLDTRIGADGVRLSGGQRQRIALARALLRRCPILVFDEATAMFDLPAEEDFVAMAHQALKDTTVILITHRKGSLALADRVVTLAQTPADPQGSHSPNTLDDRQPADRSLTKGQKPTQNQTSSQPRRNM